MKPEIAATKKLHLGKNIKRVREMRGIKQDALAALLGEDWNQQKVSFLETRETVEQDTLENVAKALGVSSDVLLNFDEEATVNFLGNTFSGNSIAYQNQFNFNPIDKIVELYERLLLEKDKQVNQNSKMNSDES